MKLKKLKLSKKIWIPLTAMVLLPLMAYSAVEIYMFSWLFGRPEHDKELFSGGSDYGAAQLGLAHMRKMSCEEVCIRSHDGLQLHGSLYNAHSGSRKFVLAVHGYKAYGKPSFAPYIDFFTDMGYSTLIVDDRAHAPSEGETIGFGAADRLDVVNWAKYLEESFGEDIEILIHGVSMGAAAVLSASGEEALPPQVRGIIADSGFSSGLEELQYQAEAKKLPAKLLLPGLELIFRLKTGENLHDNSAIEGVKKARVPILFIHGGQDMVVPPHMVYSLYSACSSEKRLLFVEEAGHCEAVVYAPEAYYRAISEFFGLSRPEN